MGAFGVVLRILQYAGVYIQLSVALNVGYGEVDNHISGNGKLFDVGVCLTGRRRKSSLFIVLILEE